jgi:glycosyltransferase involved in cell wall biosynthesis
VSVIIPIHNRPEFLPLSVSSVQRGVFQDFEIIIVDNASTDDTLAVAQNLARRDSRLRVLSLPDNVIARALNAGVRAARGQYIAQLDSDDEYTPKTLDAMAHHLDSHPEEALAISYYELMDPQGKTLEEFGIIKHLEYNRNNILRVDGAGAVRVWRKAAIEEFGGFDERDFGHYGEDYDLVLKVGERYEVGRVHQVLYRYRRHPGNSDVLRPHEMKIHNKTLARQRAILRRRRINEAEKR